MLIALSGELIEPLLKEPNDIISLSSSVGGGRASGFRFGDDGWDSYTNTSDGVTPAKRIFRLERIGLPEQEPGLDRMEVGGERDLAWKR